MLSFKEAIQITLIASSIGITLGYIIRCIREKTYHIKKWSGDYKENIGSSWIAIMWIIVTILLNIIL